MDSELESARQEIAALKERLADVEGQRNKASEEAMYSIDSLRADLERVKGEREEARKWVIALRTGVLECYRIMEHYQRRGEQQEATSKLLAALPDWAKE